MARSASVRLAAFAAGVLACAISGQAAAEDVPAPPPAKPPAELEIEGFRALIDKDLGLWKLDDEARKH